MNGCGVELINPADHPAWNELIAPFPGSTIFHTANWARLLSETYGFTPTSFAVLQGGRLHGFMSLADASTGITPRRGVSMSFADYCGGVVADRSTFDSLFCRIVEHGRENGWRFVEFRDERYLTDQPAYESYLHHVVDLAGDEAALFSRLRDSNARNIKKAYREGVSVRFSQDLQGVSDFYRLHCLTRKRHGLPPQPRRFFINLYHHLIAQNLGFAALATYRGAVVAGAICLGFGQNALYKYGASDDSYQEVRANNLVMWEALKKCLSSGYRSFSLGRSDTDNEGLINFKNGWGARKSTIQYHRFDLTSNSFRAKSGGNLSYLKEILRVMPVAVLRGIGTLSYKHMG